MSVVLVVKVSEGLVLAADSAATLMGKMSGPNGNLEGPLKTFYNAKKLLQIGDLPIGVLTWGSAFVGPRTLESLVREWEHNAHWETHDLYNEKHEDAFVVKSCAEGLLKHLTEIHAAEFADIPKEAQPAIGMVVAGYSEGEFFPEIWRFVIPSDTEVKNQRPNIEGRPNFGASWFGMTEPIVRLHFGRDEKVIKIISEKFDLSQAEIIAALKPLEYPVPFPQMPLQDAIEYADYLINVVVGRYRFVLGPEFCGGEIDIAAITQRKFSWISRKSWGIE
jgi:hypothetical protein